MVSYEIPPTVRVLLDQAEVLTLPWEMLARAALIEDALALVIPESHEFLWAALQMELGNAVTQASTGVRAANLACGVAAYRAALTVYTREAAPTQWAMTQNNLGNALGERAQLERGKRRRTTLEDAIAAAQAALTVHRPEATPTEWAAAQVNLAISLRERAQLERGERRRASLAAAIASFNAVLAVYTPETAPTEWAAAQVNLAAALRHRAQLEQGEQRWVTLDDAIAACHASFTVYTPEMTPTEWAATQVNLGNALGGRASLEWGAARRASLEAAIGSFEAVLAVYTRKAFPADWAMTQHNLAISLRERAQLERGERRRASLAAAIAAVRAALTVRTHEAAPIDWARMQNTRGLLLQELAGLEAGTSKRASLQQAIAAYRAALTVYTREAAPTQWAMTQNNLGNALGERAQLERGKRHWVSLEAAIVAYYAALTVYTRTDAPTLHRDIARAAGRLLFDAGEWERASALYTMALDAQNDLFALSLTAEDRATQLGPGGDMAATHAYALAHTGTSDAALRAATALERSRARASGEALAREQAQVEAAELVAPELLQRFIAASDHLARFTIHDASSLTDASGAGDMQELFAEASAARQAYDAALAEIRAMQPGFLELGDSISEAVAQLRPDERLVYLATTPRGAVLILINRRAGPSGLPYAEAWRDERLTQNLLVNLLQRRDEQGRIAGGLPPAQYGYGRLGAELHRVMIALGASDGVVARLARYCRVQRVHRLIVVPCGLLGLLPLHAALVDGGLDGAAPTPLAPLQDVVRMTYVPSARMWTASRQRAVQRQLHQQAVGALEVLIVSNPLPQPEAQRLAGAVVEAEALRQLVGSVPTGRLVPPTPFLDGEAATRRAIFQTLERYHATLTHAHFACHGLVELRQPERSGLLLANGARLMVRDLRAEHPLRFPQMRLATLSACQTGLPGSKFPDEVVSLPSAWLLAGAEGVVASLWPVNDSATVALMIKFYELHLQGEVEPGDALWLAQRWFRGLPQWRNEFLEAGASRAAQGPEAREVVRMLAEQRGVANPFDDETDTDDVRGEDAEAGVTRVDSASLQSGPDAPPLAQHHELSSVSPEIPESGVPSRHLAPIDRAETHEHVPGWSHPMHWAPFVYYGA